MIFLSDNGASDEALPLVKLERFKERSDILRVRTRDGREVRFGNEPSIVPGPEDTYASYGRAWANLSNTPFRYYKQWTHEGGIATPFIVHWPNGALRNGSVVRAPFQLVDVLPTVLEATGASYPAHYNGREIIPYEGRSLLPRCAASRCRRRRCTGNIPVTRRYAEGNGSSCAHIRRSSGIGRKGSARSKARCMNDPTRGSCTICRATAPRSTTWPTGIPKS